MGDGSVVVRYGNAESVYANAVLRHLIYTASLFSFFGETASCESPFFSSDSSVHRDLSL